MELMRRFKDWYEARKYSHCDPCPYLDQCEISKYEVALLAVLETHLAPPGGCVTGRVERLGSEGVPINFEGCWRVAGNDETQAEIRLKRLEWLEKMTGKSGR